MRCAQSFARLAIFGHGVTVQGRHHSIRRARRIKQDGRHRAAHCRAFHYTNEKPKNGQKRVGVKAKNRQQDGQGNRHQEWTGQTWRGPANDADDKAAKHHQNSNRNANPEDFKGRRTGNNR